MFMNLCIGQGADINLTASHITESRHLYLPLNALMVAPVANIQRTSEADGHRLAAMSGSSLHCQESSLHSHIHGIAGNLTGAAFYR